MTSADNADERHFVSPLRIGRQTAFTAVRFGAVASRPEIAALRRDLDDRLAAILSQLPAPLWREALSTIDRYAGSAGDFYSLFYVPVWSFLHWVPAAATGERLDSALLADARTAQALGLFVHLWDDHLCDGQLAVDLLRLQVRTQAWQTYLAAARRMADKVAPVSRIVDDHIDTYLTAIHAERDVHDLEAFCQRFVRQIAIWTLTPRLLGLAAGGEPAAIALRQIVESFSLAWRLLDDVQDIDLDLMEGVQSAVWHALNEPGRRAWDACRAASLAGNALDEPTWNELSRQASRPHCVPQLLERADRCITAAARAAASQGWNGMVQELTESRVPAQLTSPSRPAS